MWKCGSYDKILISFFNNRVVKRNIYINYFIIYILYFIFKKYK